MVNKLEEIIAKACPMSLAEFTALALTHPKYGYYINSDPFGVDGDFITAPEVSQIFGEVIGAWIADIWIQMGSPSSFELIECGAGRGTLMSDIMRSCKSVKGFCGSAQIRFIEASDTLKDKQEIALHGYDVTWHKYISEINIDKPCIILGNEFLDALPIEQLKRTQDGWQKKMLSVDKDTNKLNFTWGNAQKKFMNILPSKTISNEIYEVSLERIRFISECDKILQSNGGVALFIDYGYLKSHFGDTLQAVKKHNFVNILDDIGQSDITSHIDFEALASCCKSKVRITTQRHFLKSLGIEHRAKALNSNSEDLERLIGEKEMGYLFKVMCLYDNSKTNPAGF